MKSTDRTRNRRGEGSLLRAEILDAAATLLEQSGSEESITLRAVAREIGISAPSIYAHFADREAIVETLLEVGFAEFLRALRQAIDTETDPLKRLQAGCAAYLRYATEQPHRYRVLFERRPVSVPPVVAEPEVAKLSDIEAFTVLVDCLQACVDAGLSDSSDPYRDSTAIWVGLHGYATLRAGLPEFPWPDHDAVVDRLVLGPAGITPAD